METISQFFRTIPDTFSALWTFVDGLTGVIVLVVSLVLAAAFGFLAVTLRDTRGWLSATFGLMAASIAFWWAFGIIPSALIYFLDGSRDLLEGVLLPGPLPAMENAYQVTRDSLIVVETVLAVVAFSLACAAIQRRYPRTLAEGEERGPTSGGYK